MSDIEEEKPAKQLNEKLLPAAQALPAMSSEKYSVNFEMEDPEEMNDGMSLKEYLIYGGLLIGFMTAMYFLYKGFGTSIFRWIYTSLEDILQHGVWSYLIPFLSQFAFAWILFFPGMSTYNIIQAFLMKSFWKSFLLTTLGSWVSSISIFMIIKHYFRQRIIEKFRKKILFKAVYVEVKKNPWKMGISFNFMFIPCSVKNYLIALTSISSAQFSVMLVPAYIFYCGLFSYVGYSLTDITDLFQGSSFAEKTTAQKFEFVVSIILLIFSLVLIIVFFFDAKKKYHEIELEHKKAAKRVNQRIRELQALSDEAPKPTEKH